MSDAEKFAQCSPKVSPGDVIFHSIFAVNIGHYSLLQKYFEPDTA